ncbi:MAG: FHA domain-containing protein [Chloroflexi bacterium]|nr:FHA domain-containing protein [Chloroflexota bacterium]
MAANHTGKLNPDQRRALVVPGLGSFGARFSGTNVTYHAVPHNYREMSNPPRWRIMLKFGTPSPQASIGLDIYGDIILGRGSESPNSPDIDFSNLDALKLGVSRRHAMLRPTPNKLFLIDLESTNGTYVNAIPVGKGMAQALRGGETIALAGLTLELQIVRVPSTFNLSPEDDEYPNLLEGKTLRVELDAEEEEEGERTLRPGEVFSPIFPMSSKKEDGPDSDQNTPVPPDSEIETRRVPRYGPDDK